MKKATTKKTRKAARKQGGLWYTAQWLRVERIIVEGEE